MAAIPWSVDEEERESTPMTSSSIVCRTGVLAVCIGVMSRGRVPEVRYVRRNRYLVTLLMLGSDRLQLVEGWRATVGRTNGREGR